MNYIFLLYISEIILFIIFFKLSDKDILSPSVMFISVFIISTSFAVFNINKWNIEYSLQAYIVLITGIGVFALVDIIVKKIYSRQGIYQNLYKLEWKVINVAWWKLILVIVIDIVSLLLAYAEMTRIVKHYGAYGDNVIASYKILTSVLAIVDQDHAMNFVVSQLVKFVEVWGEIFSFLLICGLAKTGKIKKFAYIIPVISSIFMYILFSNRFALIRLIAYMLSCYYILWHGYRNWNRNLSWKYIRTGIIILTVFLPVFYGLTTVMGQRQHRSMFDYISVYAGGSIQHFNQYIQEPPDVDRALGGESLPTLNNFLYKFGVVDKQSVIHLEFRQLYKGTSGNVYTFFRRLIQDYGYFGMYAITILISYMFSKYYRKKIIGCNAELGTYLIRTVIYSHFFPWIMTASIEQYMFNYISVNNLIKCILIVLSMLWLCDNVCNLNCVKL